MTAETGETDETAPVVRLAVVPDESSAGPTAEQRMWAYYQAERSKGRTPTGAELDRIASTSNYGRRVLRRWKQTGQIDHSGDPMPGDQLQRRENAIV